MVTLTANVPWDFSLLFVSYATLGISGAIVMVGLPIKLLSRYALKPSKVSQEVEA